MNYAMDMQLGSGWKLAVIDDASLMDDINCTETLLRQTSDIIDASVPGDWILDLVRAGYLEDPYYGDNYLKLRDYENYHAFYYTQFDFDSESTDRVYVLFEGIDTVADIYLNGRKIGHAENMYIPHEFEAQSVRHGRNELMIHILPAVLEARKYHIAAHNTILKYNYEALTIRKSASMFGWDICPRIVGGGLWRPVHIIRKKAEYVKDVFLWVDSLKDGIVDCTAVFDVEIGRDRVSRYEIKMEGLCRQSRFAASQKLWFVHGRVSFRIESPELWWPCGYGEANMYDITITLLKDGEPVDVLEYRQGLRTAELVYDEYIRGDKAAEFCFVINGKRVYVKGTNWVPADAFHSNDINRIPRILELISDIGCNAVRVWGGGVYENDYFYNWCDENGIMIWQDFMMACGLYPRTERMKEQLTQEAEVQVCRLRNHACICLWAGDNECDSIGNRDVGGKADPNSNVLTRKVIPEVLQAEDMTRPYLPSSPYISEKYFALKLQESTPEQHLWGPRDYFKGHFYHDHNATFASEMGYHGCNSPESIRRFIPEDKLWPWKDNDMWLYHASAPELEDSPYAYRIDLMSSQIGYVFVDKPADLDQYAHMSQICQAEAKKYFVESFRSNKGVRTGLIWWNIMDCWPQFSDAVVDYYFCKKLAYYYIRRSQQPLCLMMDDRTGENVLYAVNDMQTEQSISYRVYDVDTGETIASGDSEVDGDAVKALQTVRDDGEIHFYAIEWIGKDENKGVNHYLQGRPLYDYSWYMDCIKKLGFDEFEGFEGTL